MPPGPLGSESGSSIVLGAQSAESDDFLVRKRSALEVKPDVAYKVSGNQQLEIKVRERSKQGNWQLISKKDYK